MSNSQKPPSLQPNEIIKRTKPDYNWKVIVELGKGGYGTVNKVIKVNEEGFAIDDKEYAMKTEQKFASKHSSRLKIERNVMASYSKCDAQCKEHFPELIDFGQSPVWKWIVMTIVGPSLEELKMKYKPSDIPPSTILQCGLQTMKAIHDFHQIGFLHRDIKPANYCIGYGSKSETIYVLDFGLARKYRLPNGQVRPPRPKTKMIGTPRYCSRASHRCEELGRRDDYESWFFMFIDLVDTTLVDWKGLTRPDAYAKKQELFTKLKTYEKEPMFKVISIYLDTLVYDSDVKFGFLRDAITDYARSCKLTLKEPLVWFKERNDNESGSTPTTSATACSPSSSTGTGTGTGVSKIASNIDQKSIASDRNEENSLDGSKTGTWKSTKTRNKKPSRK